MVLNCSPRVDRIKRMVQFCKPKFIKADNSANIRAKAMPNWIKQSPFWEQGANQPTYTHLPNLSKRENFNPKYSNHRHLKNILNITTKNIFFGVDVHQIGFILMVLQDLWLQFFIRKWLVTNYHLHLRHNPFYGKVLSILKEMWSHSMDYARRLCL